MNSRLRLSTIMLATMMLILVCGCSDVNLEYWVPTTEVKGYYLLVDGGALRIGAKFEDKDNLYLKTIKKGKETEPETLVVNYRQQLGMYDFTTTGGRITSITVPSKDCILCSSIYVGMTEEQLAGALTNFVTIDNKGTKIFLDTENNIAIEAKFDKDTKMSNIIRVSCLRIKD